MAAPSAPSRSMSTMVRTRQPTAVTRSTVIMNRTRPKTRSIRELKPIAALR